MGMSVNQVKAISVGAGLAAGAAGVAWGAQKGDAPSAVTGALIGGGALAAGLAAIYPPGMNTSSPYVFAMYGAIVGATLGAAIGGTAGLLG